MGLSSTELRETPWTNLGTKGILMKTVKDGLRHQL